MSLSRHSQLVLYRGFALVATIGAAWGATGLSPDATVLRSILIGYATFFLVGSLLANRHFSAAPVPIALLLGDLIAIGSVGCWLHVGFEPQISFLAGYVVGVLVAVVGRSLTSAVLGSLAGAMTMGLATALFATIQQQSADLVNVGLQTVLLVAATFLAARVMGWIQEDAERHRMTDRLESAMRERESEAAELVTFAQGLASSSNPKEITEVTTRYLRCHVPVRARAMAIVSGGETAALWEEDGRLTDDHFERRRNVLQDALARGGNGAVIPRLDGRSMGNRILPEALDFQTAVEVPIRSEGRAAGLLFLADPKRGALDEKRITVLADVARRVGQALQRIERQGVEEHRRTSLLLRQMREGVMLLGADGTVLLANPAARQALGVTNADEGLPTSIGEVALSELAQTPAGVSRRFKARLQPIKNHPPIQLACTAMGILDGQKRMGTLVTLSDVTDEERARSRLLQSEKLTLVGQTLAGVAHELNNPLTALIGYADLLRATDVDEKLARSLQKIQEQAVRATRIVKNLLSVARQRNPERTLLDLASVATSVVELFAYEARLTNVKMDLEAPEDLGKVLGDPHSLQQIFVNLVQNAIHALKDSDGDRRLQVRLQTLPDAVLATVTDSGDGIPADLRTRVFEPFFTTKGPNKGTGLGLALSRSVAREHGGDLILGDAGPRGARFVLRLPLARHSATSTETVAPKRELSLGLRVLVVDDEKDVREAVVAALGRLGCQVTSSSSAGEAVRLLGEEVYDTILTDVRMPGTTGIEFHDIVKEKTPGLATLFVFMTGDFTNEDVQQAVRETGRPLLEKPFTVDDLVAILQGFGPAAAAPALDASRADPAPAAAPSDSTGASALARVLGS